MIEVNCCWLGTNILSNVRSLNIEQSSDTNDNQRALDDVDEVLPPPPFTKSTEHV